MLLDLRTSNGIARFSSAVHGDFPTPNFPIESTDAALSPDETAA